MITQTATEALAEQQEKDAMKITDYLLPEHIQNLYSELLSNIVTKQKFEEQLSKAKAILDQQKVPVVTDPDFKAAKNMALEEIGWRSRFPDTWKIIDDDEAEIKDLNNKIALKREMINQYRMLIDYFTTFKE